MNIQRAMNAMASMVDCLGAGLEAIEEAGGPATCMTTLMPGAEVPLDYCGENCGGMAWVRLVTIVPDEGIDASRLRGCFQPMEAHIEMGIVRGYEFDGEILPDSDSQLSMAVRQMDDAAVMSNALMCCSEEHDVTAVTYVPTGPQGGCYGGTWTVRLPL